MSEKGGITKGKSHKEGGIPMVVKSTGQQVELEGGEGVINKRNMSSDTKFEFQGKQMTTCEIASAINSANGNGVQIDCDDVTGKKYAYEDGGVVFIGYKEDEIMYEPIDRKYYANDKEFDSLEEAQKFLDSGGVNEDLRGAYERGLFEKGGWILVDGDTERKLGEYATESEAREMMYEYEGNGMLVQKSVWEKSNKYEGGGGVKDYESLIGKYVNIYSMGVSLPTEHQIKDVQVSGENFRYRYVTLKFDLGIAPILVDEATAFMNNEIIYVNNNKEEFGIQLIPNQFGEGGGVDKIKIGTKLKNSTSTYTITKKTTFGFVMIAENGDKLIKNEREINELVQRGQLKIVNEEFKEGGDVPKANKMFHLPLELAVYVPSTQDVDKVISDSELDARVDEVSKYLATIFGGFTKSDKIGGFVSSQSELVTEEVVPVVSFATKQDYDANKNKLVTKLSEWARKWGQEAIGFEFEGDLYYVPQKFDKGGDVRDFDWYQGFKKQELKRGTEHEMEHVDSISKFKKKGVSDKEVAQAIAKDHLEEDENYYIELDKMESSRKLSEALNDFEKQRGYRKNSAKYNLGGSMMNAKELVHIKFTEDFNGVLRKKDGKYISESMFPKGKVYKFTFLFNDGRNTALEFGNTGAYILVPNDIINVVGFNEGVYGNGGSIKAYQSIDLDSNDKSILEMLRNIEDRNATSQQREKLGSFKGNNVVNDLSSKMIQKIYGILFKNHNLENKILNLYLSNIGVGNILLFAPSFLNKTMVSFDEHNQFSQVEKDIADIVTQGARAFLYNDFEMKSMDAIIHVYPKTNPETDTLCSYFYKTTKKAIALGVCEFTSKEKLDEFQTSIRVNQGSMSQNQMITFTKSNEYFVINEGITDEGQYTLIYTMTKF